MSRFFVLLAVLFSAVAHGNETLNEAQRLLDGGRAQQALDMVESELRTNPRDAEAQFLRGLSLAELGRSEEAIAVFERMTQSFTDLPEPYNNLAVLRAQRGEYDEARKALEAAVIAHPSYGTAHENLGDIYTILATVSYNRALALNQGNQAVRVKLDKLKALTSVTTDGAPVSPRTVDRAPAVAQQAAPDYATPDYSRAPVDQAGRAAVTASSRYQGGAAAPVQSARMTDSTVGTARNPDQVLSALYTWAASWSSQDVDAYLAAYGANFRPPNGMSRSRWERERRRKVSRPRSVNVDVDDVDVKFVGDEMAIVKFEQRYRSDNYRDQVSKTLVMEREVDGWRIVSEESN